MGYVLGEPPRTRSDAFDALENVFSSEEFSARDAEEVLTEVLDIDSHEARNELKRLLRGGYIEEA